MRFYFFITYFLFVSTCFSQADASSVQLSPLTHLSFVQPKDLCLNLNHDSEGYRVRQEILKRGINCGSFPLSKPGISNEDFCKKNFVFESANYFSCMADRLRSKDSTAQSSSINDLAIKKCKRLGINENSTDFQLCLKEGFK